MMLAKLVKTLLLCGLAVAAIMWLESISQPPVSAFFDSSPGIPTARLYRSEGIARVVEPTSTYTKEQFI